MQPKVSVFNPDFSFDFDDGTTSRKEPLKRKLVQEDENNENNSDLEENNESKKELETLINKKGIFIPISFKENSKLTKLIFRPC